MVIWRHTSDLLLITLEGNMIRFCRFHNTSEGKVNRNSVANKAYIAFSFMLSHLVLFNPQARAVTPGFTLGEFSVTQQGASSYSVPLSVSPGTAGMQPTLSFNYNSNSGNSAMGLGWNLSGLSQITRCPATIAQDGFYDPVDYDDNDRFCLDGQRLQLSLGFVSDRYT